MLFYCTYLFYMAVICIVPALVPLVTYISSVMPKHSSAIVHHHCIQSVLAVTLEETINYYSKYTISRHQIGNVSTCAKSAENASFKKSKSKVSWKVILLSSFRMKPLIFQNRFRCMHKIWGREQSLTLCKNQLSDWMKENVSNYIWVVL